MSHFALKTRKSGPALRKLPIRTVVHIRPIKLTRPKQSCQMIKRDTVKSQQVKNLERSSIIPNAGAVFSHDEVALIDECVKATEDKQAPVYKSPSKLQQIKNSHFEPSQSPLHFDFQSSSSFFSIGQSLDKEQKLELERNESLLSVGDTDTDDAVLPCLHDYSNAKRCGSDSLHIPITEEDIKSSVLDYCMSQTVDHHKGPMLFNATINQSYAKEIETQGRKCILRAIRHNVPKETLILPFIDYSPERKSFYIEKKYHGI